MCARGAYPVLRALRLARIIGVRGRSARNGLCHSCACGRVAGVVQLLGSVGARRFVAAPLRRRAAAPLRLWGRRFSRSVSGDGDQTDAFFSPRSTKCPLEVRLQTSVYLNIWLKSKFEGQKQRFGRLRQGKLFLQIPLLRIFLRARQERNLWFQNINFLERLQNGFVKSDAPVLSKSSLF